jgi:release factor glutamine methyltransferase
MLDRVPGIELFAADLESVAVECARANVGQRATVFEGDLFEPLPDRLRGRIDVIAANAPYVPTGEISMMPPEARDCEPNLALDGGLDGLRVQRRIISEAPRWLSADGVLLIETGKPQIAATSQAMREHALVPQTEHDDEIGATIVIGRSGAAT